MHLQPKSLSRYPLWLRPFFWSQKRRYGEVLTPGLLWGRVPKLFAAVAILYGVLDRRRSPIDPVLRSLVTVRVSQLNWCEFCVDINAASLAKRCGSLEKVSALAQWRESSLFEAREQVVLTYVEAMTITGERVSEALIADLKRHFDEEALIELTGLIAFQNMSSKFNSALDVPAQGFCQIPAMPKKGTRIPD